MAIVFSYVASTNTVTVTGGTSGTPATFADFVTADRAGTGTSLKAATAGSKTLTLTYPVRPVEFCAIVVKLIVASKTTETDYLFITGTDAWGAAQTESIDVSAGNGTYTTTKRWRTITNISCSDATDGTGTVWANGTLAVTQDIWGVVWNLGNEQYQIAAIFKIGDDSASTNFASENESVYFYPVQNNWRGPYNVRANATLRIGKQVNGESQNGSRWASNNVIIFDSIYINENSDTAVVEIYGSIVSFGGLTAAWKWFDGVSKIQKSQFYTTSYAGWSFRKSASTFDGAYFVNGLLYFNDNPSLMQDIHHDFGGYGAIGVYSGDGLIVAPKITNPQAPGYSYRNVSTGTLTVRDPMVLPTRTTITHDNAAGTTYLQFTVDIHIADKNGANIPGASVLCNDKDGNTTGGFAAQTTDANGNITTQYIYRQKWVGTSETETDYSPHKFTISKAGYQTLVLENITVSAPIKWHLELNPSIVMSRIQAGN